MTTFTAEMQGNLGPEGGVKHIMTPRIHAAGPELATEELVEMVEDVNPGDFALDTRFLPGLPKNFTTGQFIEVDEFKRTREASLHEVKFGQLVLRGAGGAEHTLHVALKPQDYPAEAAQTYAAASYIESGGLEDTVTFRPLGFHSFESGQPALLSVYRHHVRSIDTVLWNPNAINNHDQTTRALGCAAATLARIHSQGWSHGDAFAKNFAWDITRPRSTVTLNDVDETRPFPNDEKGKLDVQEAQLAIDQDLQVFMSSLFILKDRGVELPTDYVDRIWTKFCLSYIKRRKEQQSSLAAPTSPKLAAFLEEQKNYNGA